MENHLENLTIGEFAKAAGVNVETIRFYQRKGLIPEPDRPYGSIRRYGLGDVARVQFVKAAQRLGSVWTKSSNCCVSKTVPIAKKQVISQSKSSKMCGGNWQT